MVQPLQTDVQASSERSQIPVPHVELPATHCPDCASQASSPLHATPSVHVFTTPAQRPASQWSSVVHASPSSHAPCVRATSLPLATSHTRHGSLGREPPSPMQIESTTQPAHWSTHSCPLHSRWSPQLPHSTCLPQPSSTLPHSNVGRHFALLGTQASSWPALPASAASAGPPPLAAAAGALPPSAAGARLQAPRANQQSHPPTPTALAAAHHSSTKVAEAGVCASSGQCRQSPSRVTLGGFWRSRKLLVSEMCPRRSASR